MSRCTECGARGMCYDYCGADVFEVGEQLDEANNRINELEVENKKLQTGNSNLHIKYMNLIEENLKLRECVEFYADYRNMLGDLYKQDLSDPFETEFSKTNERCIGKLARKTLAEIDGKVAEKVAENVNRD